MSFMQSPLARTARLDSCSKAFEWKAYWVLCKPRVVALMILTSIVGMQLAIPGLIVPWRAMIFGNAGIALMAFGAAAINHIIDQRYDARMARTQYRPLPLQQINNFQAGIFAFSLTLSGFLLLFFQINTLTAYLTLATFIGYAFIYTAFLKHITPQNIVIGGLSGAMPPLLGWTAVTGQIDPQALLLVLIIFLWTPPHFWSLAIYRHKEYANANIPMLPNTHGIAYTRLSILLYVFLLIAASFLPVCIGMSGWIYCISCLLLNAYFLQLAIQLYRHTHFSLALQTFRFSIVYLMVLFLSLLIDHWSSL